MIISCGKKFDFTTLIHKCFMRPPHIWCKKVVHGHKVLLMTNDVAVAVVLFRQLDATITQSVLPYGLNGINI